MGRKLLSEKTALEDVRNTFTRAPFDVRQAGRNGLRENIDAVVGRARATIADLEAGNVDFDTGTNAVGEAVAALRAMTTPNNIKKVRMVLGDKDAARLLQELSKMGDAMVLRSAVARGSATAIRQAGRDARKSVTQPDVVSETVGRMGSPLEAGKGITERIAGTDAAALALKDRKVDQGIVDALTKIKGKEAQSALKVAERAMNKKQPLLDAEIELIRKALGIGVGLGAYQSGQAALGPQ
jgi:hypothetical protein